MKLRLLTYNIHGARGIDKVRDFRRIGEFLKKEELDVVLIQEMDTRFFDRSTDQDIADMQTDHFPYFIAAPTIYTSHGWYGNALLSRYPVMSSNIIDISSVGKEPRNILEVILKTPAGDIHVVNTHKGLNPLERGRQMRKLSEILQTKTDLPLIVGGDMNEWQTYAGALRKLNSELFPIPSGPTFPTRAPFLRLDRMWCRPNNIVLTSSVLKSRETRLYSDHYPVLVEVQI